MLNTVFGLPVHPLIVHATVVVVPTAALAVLLYALWPRFRAWSGWGPLALAVAAVVLTPLSTGSGESLEHKVGESQLVRDHAELGDLLIWWVVPLVLLAAVLYWWHRQERDGRSSRGLVVLVAVLPVVVALGTLVQVVLIGHSGAKAAWSSADASVSSRASQGGVPILGG